MSEQVKSFYERVSDARHEFNGATNALLRMYQTETPAHETLQKIILVCAIANKRVNEATESDWPHILSDALDAIETLCKEQLTKRKE